MEELDIEENEILNDGVISLDGVNINENMNISKKIYSYIKRFIDILAGIFGTLITIPLFIVIKIVYMLNKDFAPIIFKQERIGLNGKLFNIYKFRTMVVDADKVLFETLKKDKKLRKEYNLYKKLHNDPRITKCGKFLRKTSLDEFPQFFNVLLGQMSLIGNRPYLVREQKDMLKYEEKILQTKPGITGLWQTSGRSEITFDERLKIEYEYSDKISFRTDILIFLQTINVLVLKKGAK